MGFGELSEVKFLQMPIHDAAKIKLCRGWENRYPVRRINQ